MLEFRYLEEDRMLNIEKIVKLYKDASWTNYLKNIEALTQGIKNSLEILVALRHGEIVGLIRVVGDGFTIIYIQDIIVLKEYQNQGIGRELVDEILKKYETVRQIVLLTDRKEALKRFYGRLGFINVNEKGLLSFIKG